MRSRLPHLPPATIAAMSKGSSRSPEFKANRIAALDRDGWLCTWPGCAKPLEGDDATADHIIPIDEARKLGWSQHEIDALTNLASMCRRHNGMKRDLIVLRLDYRAPRWFEG